jgi:hypothetical protein
MKNKLLKTVLFASTIVFLFASCNKEPAVNTLSIKTAKTDVDAGVPIKFTLDGEADFCTFYSGEEGKKYSEYPDANSTSVDLEEDAFYYTYKIHGTVTSVFVVSSYGNWSEEEDIKEVEFTMTVTDARIGIQEYTVKTSGIGQTFKGVIDTAAYKVDITVPTGTRTDLVTNLTLASSNATVKLADGSTFENNQRIEYADPVTLNVIAPSGKEQDWIVTVTEE